MPLEQSVRESGGRSDAEVRALGRADRRAGVDALYRIHSSMVFSNLYLMLRDAEAARDLTQETFLKAFTQEGFFGCDLPFKPWLLKVASRLALNHVRDARRRARRDQTQSLPSSRDPLEEMLARQVQQELHRELLGLPIHYRQVMVLKYHQGLSCEEIGDVLEVPPGTVMSHLFRARLVLRRRMR